jgi:hypothetical protein
MEIAPGYLLLGSVRSVQYTSLNTAPWALFEKNGLVKLDPAGDHGPPYIITLTADGQKVLESAK